MNQTEKPFKMPRRGPKGAAERNWATHTLVGQVPDAYCTDCGAKPGDLVAAPCAGKAVAVTIPFDACICDGKVAKPRANCWATTHNLKAPK